jgi:RNA polymerase sigma-70 factor (ECF subfamily)
MADRQGRRGAGSDIDRGEPHTQTAPGESARAHVLAIVLSQRERALASATRRLESREAARDVVQMALLKAIEGIESVRRPERIVPWFHRIVSNVVTDYQRHREAYRRALERMASYVAATDARSEGAVDCECLYDVLPTLRPAYAAMLRRVDLEGWPIEEVARQAGVTRNNARVRLHRARQALRRSWVEVCGGSPLETCVPCHCEVRLGEASQKVKAALPGKQTRTRHVMRRPSIRPNREDRAINARPHARYAHGKEYGKCIDSWCW